VKIVWRINSHFAPGGLPDRAHQWFKKSVEARSGGRLTVEIYYSEALGFKRDQAFSVLKDGLVDIDEPGPGNEAESAFVGIPGLPFLFTDTQDAFVWAHNELIPAWNQSLEKNWNARILAQDANWPAEMFFSKEPLSKSEDWVGKKIRTYSGPNVDTFKAIGAEPYVIGVAEIYTALQRGMIDSAITSYVSATECKFWEVLKYVDRTILSAAVNYVAVSNKSLNALPADLRDVVLAAGLDEQNWYAYNGALFQRDGLKMLTDGGMKVIDPAPGTLDALRVKVKNRYQDFVTRHPEPEIRAILQKLGVIQ